MNHPTPPQTANPLAAAGYVLDAQGRVWGRPGQPSFAYSDGDDVEQRIGLAIESSSDVSLFSEELRKHQIDWPSIYHLSAARANLLRPIQPLFRAGQRVLEIGAGCGALSRYLGEQGASVLALEGSPRRAGIAAERCRDLPNVTILTERLDAFDASAKFDVVTLIGVLEYARMYTTGEDPVQETLRKAHSLLADDGVLLIAIENQLGLKYFAGVNEDHIGRPMAGIQDHYDAHGVVTFGKAELASRIGQAGFTSTEFALPFPDYKLPQSVVLPAGYLTQTELDASSLCGQAASSDRQMTRAPLFSLRQALRVLGRNELLADLSNSFLVLATKSAGAVTFDALAPDVLAEHFASERQAAYTKVSRFTRQPKGIFVARERLCPEVPSPPSQLIVHKVESETYEKGTNWGDKLEAIVSRPGWGVEQIAEWLSIWRNALAAKMQRDSEQDPFLPEDIIPGELFDALPSNLAKSCDGGRFFDLEWQVTAPITFGFLAFRAISVSMTSVSAIALPSNNELLHIPTLMRATFRNLGMMVTSTTIQSYIDLEASLQDEIFGLLRRPPDPTAIDSFSVRAAPDVSALSSHVDMAAASLVHSLTEELEQARLHNQHLQLQLDGKVHHTTDLERRVTEVMLETEQARNASLEQAQAYQRELEAKCQLIDTRQAALDALREQAQHHYAQLAELAAALSMGATKIASLREELIAAEQRIEAGDQEAMALSASLRQELITAEQRIETGDRMSKELGEALRISMEREQSVSDELESLRQQHEAAGKVAQRLEQEVARLLLAESELAQLEATVRDKDNEIHRLWPMINELQAESDQHAALHIGARERIEALDRELCDTRRFETAAAHLEDELDRVTTSRSWKLTAPLRAVNSAMRRAARVLRNAVGRTVERTYRALPVSLAGKRAIKGAVFRATGGLLSRTNAYRRWDADLRTHAAELPMRAIESPVHGAPVLSGTANASMLVNDLWEADGVREWSDYLPTRQRIDAVAAQLRDVKEAKPIPVLDFTGHALQEDVARNVVLPPPPDRPDVTILIPAFNHLATTLECIASIAAFHDPNGPSFEVLVADDGSTDDTAAVLSQVPNLRIVTQSVNLGFLRNCNAAAPHARGRYLLLLNNDVQVTDGWLGPLVSCLEEDASVGAVGPKIVYPSGWLQEAGTSLRRDGTSEMVGLNDLPDLPRFAYTRDVDYCSGACLLLRTEDFRALGGFDEAYAPAYCEDSDLCMRLRAQGRRIRFCAETTVVHHLSKTSNDLPSEYKLACISRNLATFSSRWRGELDAMDDVRTIAFYLPQFHPMAENDLWWGQGFTEWTNVGKARPNYLGHYQPRVPADLGYYDLRLTEVMEQQAALARRYGVGGFCFYYYWFAGKRLLERPIEQMLATGRPDFPFCLCWANENWTRRWDGQEQDVLMAQQHSDTDDLAVIRDLMRYFRSPNYIRIDGRPLILVYRITLFPDFARTAALWRQVCRDEGIGDIYIAQVESFELVSAEIHPHQLGCDAAIEFPPQGMAEPYPVTAPLLNPQFEGAVADYRDLAVRYATRELPAYKRFMSVMPGWDNTARRQNNSYSFDHATPGAFQAWLETTIERTKQQYSGDERLVFINAWNEWAEGAYLEPDRRFGHSFLQAHANACDSSHLVRNGRYSL